MFHVIASKRSILEDGVEGLALCLKFNVVQSMVVEQAWCNFETSVSNVNRGNDSDKRTARPSFTDR